MMKCAAYALVSVAKEIAQRAKDSMPPLQENEVIKREWLADGAYHRETELDGRRFISSYNFRGCRQKELMYNAIQRICTAAIID